MNGHGLSREVFGYASASSLGDPNVGYPSWNFDLLSTVAFFAIHVYTNGELLADSNWNVWNSSALAGLVTTAHAHGVKVVATIVGPHLFADQCSALNSDSTTVAQLMIQVRAKNVDGVNIDYEGSGLGTCNTPGYAPMTNQALVTKLAKDMRAGLDAAGPGYYLSIATYSGSASGNDGYFNIPDLNQYVDSFFVMAYDMDEANQGTAPLACATFCMGPVSPLANYYWNDSTSMSQYSALVGPGKVILGQPYYGRVACVSSPLPHAYILSYPPSDPRHMTAASYLDAAAAISSPDIHPGTYSINRDLNDPAGQDRWDAWYDDSLGCYREMYWSDTTTLGVRYNFVNQNNLRGVGIWTLNYGGGASVLWNTLQNYFVACTGATLSAVPASPQLSATPVQLTATSTNCSSPLYEFWIQPPGGSWSIVQGYSTDATLNWSTAGMRAGTYRFTVYARASSTQGIHGTPPFAYDSAVGIDFALTTIPCTGVTTSASPSAAIAGTQVTFTATAAGCPNPEYEYWILNPGATSYRLAQGYSSASSLTWNTGGLAAGAYRINVWVRDTSSLGTSGNASGTWDAYDASLYYSLIGGCASVAESATPANAAMIGTGVTVTAAAAGCPDANPMYEFWIKAPGASVYTLGQAYSSSPTFSWPTSGLTAGTYRLNVWVRDANSSGAYSNASGGWDAYNANLYYTLTAGCPSVAESAAASGSTVTITASAPGCSNPQFEFWILYPGASAYKLVQPYGSSTTFAWNTAGLPKGTYRINVWVRDASSAGVYSNASGTWDAYNAGLYYTLS